LSSGWQGDNSGGTAQSRTDNEWVKVPVPINRDGTVITGTVLGRIVNRSGLASQPIFVQSNRFPYSPAYPDDTRKARLTSRVHETMAGQVIDERPISSTEWAWGKCDNGDPTTAVFDSTDPTHICLKGGFKSSLLYQVVFTAKNPYVLGVGFAAFRDLESFFKYEADSKKAPNPLAGKIRWSVSRGVSQSGNFLRGWLHLGFNQDEARRQVSDGMWPIIAGRRISLNSRWAQPDGVLELYQAGSEGPQWWAKYEDKVRNLPKRGILDRCRDSRTCPKIFEHFGAAEIWELKLGIEWVGTDAKKDIPLPSNVRRYYIPSTTHGGGGGGFTATPANLPNPPNCPGNNYGTGALKGNPVPHAQTVNALRLRMRSWVMAGTPPPDSLYPRLDTPVGHEHHDDGDDEDDDDDQGSEGRRCGKKHVSNLVPPTQDAMGFPKGLPVLRDIAPKAPGAARINGEDEVPFINPVLHYDWGSQFNPSDGSGIPTNFPPPIKHVITALVPRVDSDGNELGGVPVVLRDAPLGSYFGWNITADGARPFHKSQNCDYTGGMIPFARTEEERAANNDPRPSLKLRYHDHGGYVQAVHDAAARAVAMGFLLQEDADDLERQANLSDVLNP